MLIQARAEDFLGSLKPESVSLAVIDPPYFQVLGESWDWQWTTESEYLEWLKGIVERGALPIRFTAHGCKGRGVRREPKIHGSQLHQLGQGCEHQPSSGSIDFAVVLVSIGTCNLCRP